MPSPSTSKVKCVRSIPGVCSANFQIPNRDRYVHPVFAFGTDQSAPRPATVVAISAGLLLFSFWGLPPAWYVPVNLVAAVGLLWLAQRIHLTPSELGLGREQAPAGMKWGIAGGFVVAVVLALGVAIPATRPLFDDARAAGIGPGLLAYRALIRIPLGTVLLEEVAFRSVLLAAWRRVASLPVAVIGSSVVFGLWHIRPAIDLLIENDVAADGPVRLLVVGGAVAGTALAGVAFCWLRVRSDSLLAPALAHLAANSLATVFAYLV
ncbi:MAG: CPBP family intramembrane metalloprotease [Acidimicrobiia bacterium]|nr:CPBP family intramembrane metalloprotease [Acidimicrobiia bacterium]